MKSSHDLIEDKKVGTGTLYPPNPSSFNWHAAEKYFQQNPGDIKLSKKLENTKTGFVKFNGSKYAISSLVGKGSDGVTVKRLIASPHENALPQMVIKSHRLHKRRQQNYNYMEAVNNIEREAGILKDLKQKAGIVTTSDQNKYYTVMPLAGKSVRSILDQPFKCSFKYLQTDTVSKDNLEPCTIYLYINKRKNLRCCFLDASDYPQHMDELSKETIQSLDEIVRDGSKRKFTEDTDLDSILEDKDKQMLIDYVEHGWPQLMLFYNLNHPILEDNLLEDNQRFDMAIQLCLQVYKLHQGWASNKGIKYAHGDLHTGNFTLDDKGNIQLIDFGSAVDASSASVSHMATALNYQAKSGYEVERNPTVIEWDNFSLMRCLCMPSSIAKNKIQAVHMMRMSLLTKGMVEKYKLAEYLNTENGYCRGTEPGRNNADDYQPESIEIAAVLINAKMDLGIDMQDLKNRKIASILASLYMQGKSPDEIHEILDDEMGLDEAFVSAETKLGKPDEKKVEEVVVEKVEQQPEQNNNPPDQPVVKKSIFTYIKDKALDTLRKYPIICGMLIGLAATVLITLIVASIYFSGGAAIPIYAAAHFIGGAFASGVAAGVTGAVLIGLKLALAGALLGGLGGAIAKLFMVEKQPPRQDIIGFKSTTAGLIDNNMPARSQDGKPVVHAKPSSYGDKKVSAQPTVFQGQPKEKIEETSPGKTNSHGL